MQETTWAYQSPSALSIAWTATGLSLCGRSCAGREAHGAARSLFYFESACFTHHVSIFSHSLYAFLFDMTRLFIALAGICDVAATEAVSSTGFCAPHRQLVCRLLTNASAVHHPGPVQSLWFHISRRASAPRRHVNSHADVALQVSRLRSLVGTEHQRSGRFASR